MNLSFKACLTFFIFLVLIPSSAYGQLDAHISVGQLPPPARIAELVGIFLHVTNIGAVTITDITINNLTIEPPVCVLYLAIPLVTTLLNPGESLRFAYACTIESDDTVNVKITASASGKSPSTVNSNEASGFFDLKGYGDFLESITISDTITTSVHRVVSLEENLTFSDSISIHLSKTLTETLSISDSIDVPPYPPTVTGPPIIDPPPVGTTAPEPAVTVQKSSSSGGGGRIGVNVSPKISDTTTTTSMDRIATWLSTPEHFKVALHNLIQQDIVDLEVSQIRDPPEWFYTTVEFWSTEQIDDEEFFNALSYILKN